MKIENDIGWCDATTNAVTGCDKVSPGCKNCYAESGTRARVLRAKGIETWGPKGVRYPVNFEPVFRRLNKLCICDKCHETEKLIADAPMVTCLKCSGRLRRIRLFADSNSDWLDPRWPVETLAKFLDAMRLAPNVDVLLLTKRIENFRTQLAEVCKWRSATGEGDQPVDLFEWIERWLNAGGYSVKPPSNVWLGVSVENQKMADERIPQLLKTPAAVRFLSVEPLLEKVNLDFWYDANEEEYGPYPGSKNPTNKLHWVIVGGESGKNRRDCGVEAIESVAQQCVSAGVPVYCKQDCAFLPGQKGRLSDNAWSFKEFPK